MWRLCIGLSVTMLSSSFCSIKETLTSLEQEARVQNATFGLYAVAEKTHQILLDCHSNESLLPNSIVKVITTAAALQALGEDFSYTTKLLVCGDVVEGVLKGDLVIIGVGDPSLGSERFKEDKVLEKWTTWIKELGIQEILGDMIGDSSSFEKSLAPASWIKEDVGNYYGAGACGLNFHDNSYAITFKLGSKIGEQASIENIDPFVELQHINEVITADRGTGDQACVFGGEYVKTHFIKGTLPLGTPTYTIKGSIPSPAEFCANQLKAKLGERGVIVQGQAKAYLEPHSRKGASKSYSHQSPLLKDLVYLTNQESINLYAESLLKTMGLVKKGKGTLLDGLEVIQDYLKDLKVDTKGWSLADGSGLSRENRISAKGFVDFLLKVTKEPYFPTLLHSLLSKKEDRGGFFKQLLSDPVLKGKLFFKTGYSSQGQSIAGFLVNQQGDRIAFCMVFNHFSSDVIKQKVRELLCQLASAE